MLKVYLTNSDGTSDISDLCTEKTISGEYSRCVRTFEFGLISNASDENMPVVNCPLGSGVIAKENDKTLFNGFVFSRDRLTGDSEITLTCFDRGIYLNRNEAIYKFSNQTPEAATARIAADFGISVGSLAKTGVTVNRKFVGNSLSDIIYTMYTLASEQTKKSYVIRFDDNKLCVIERGDTSVLYIDGSINLMQAAINESIENMVNQVVIYDKNDKLLSTLKNDEYIKLYGLMQEYIKQGTDDVSKKAQKELDDNGITRKITVQTFGNSLCITGNAVTVKEEYTGLVGLFQIDSDTHTWKKGQYYNKLTLNFKKIMNEKTSGSGNNE
ncbi:MAG: hypothetical protein LKJ25_01040 [Clostridia bacterium]|jgi:hypothetical protein|nr:hypothetical protein [Clostridia bacterium]